MEIYIFLFKIKILAIAKGKYEKIIPYTAFKLKSILFAAYVKAPIEI